MAAVTDDGAEGWGVDEFAPESPYTLMSPAEVRAWYAYMKVHLRLRYEMNHQLRVEFGLSLADYDVLIALISERDASMTITGLAVRIGWERSRVSHQVKRMADRGLVQMAVDEDDRRSTRVSMTVLGRSSFGSASVCHADLVRTAFLDALDEGELSLFASMLERLFDRLIEHGTMPRPNDHP